MTPFLAAIASLALATAIFWSWLHAKRAADSSKAASECLRRLRRQSELEAEIAELSLSFQNLLESHKKLRSREGMRALRAERAAPKAETKAELLQRLGLAGKAGPAFARAQLGLDASSPD